MNKIESHLVFIAFCKLIWFNFSTPNKTFLSCEELDSVGPEHLRLRVNSVKWPSAGCCVSRGETRMCMWFHFVLFVWVNDPELEQQTAENWVSECVRSGAERCQRVRGYPEVSGRIQSFRDISVHQGRAGPCRVMLLIFTFGYQFTTSWEQLGAVCCQRPQGSILLSHKTKK